MSSFQNNRNSSGGSVGTDDGHFCYLHGGTRSKAGSSGGLPSLSYGNHRGSHNDVGCPASSSRALRCPDPEFENADAGRVWMPLSWRQLPRGTDLLLKIGFLKRTFCKHTQVTVAPQVVTSSQDLAHDRNEKTMSSRLRQAAMMDIKKVIRSEEDLGRRPYASRFSRTVSWKSLSTSTFEISLSSYLKWHGRRFSPVRKYHRNNILFQNHFPHFWIV